MHPIPSPLNQAGVTALEMLLCLAVMLQMLLLRASLMQRKRDYWAQSLAAKHLHVVSTAAKYYVQDHMEELLENNSMVDTPQELSIDALQKENYLAPNFINQNAFQQTTKIQLRCLTAEDAGGNALPNAPKLIQILTYTLQGQMLNDVQARAVADELGGGGGYLPTHPWAPKEENDETRKFLVGSAKGWFLDVSSIQELQPGYTARLIYVSSIEGINNTRSRSKGTTENFLHRIKSADTSRYNVMETNLGAQDGSAIQFLKAGEAEVSNTEEEEATSIRANHFRLNKQSLWNEERLQLSDQIAFRENKLIFSDEEASKQLEIGIEGIMFTAPKSKLEITAEGFSLQNQAYGFILSPNILKISDLIDNLTSLSLGLTETEDPNLRMQGYRPALQVPLSLLELKFKNRNPLLNMQSARGQNRAAGTITVDLGAETGLVCFDADGSLMAALAAETEVIYSVTRSCKPGLSYFQHLDTTAKAAWP